MVRAAGKRRGRPPATAAVVDEARADLMDAASEVYGRHGYDATSVTLIIQAAGISRPTFYKQFANKHEVLAAVVWRANEDLYRRILERLTGAATPVAQLEAVTDAYLAWGCDTGALVRILYSEIHHPASPVSEARNWVIGKLLELFQVQAREAGIKDVDPLYLDVLVGAVERAGASLFESGRIREEALARRRGIILRVLLAGLARPGEYESIPELPRQPQNR